MWLPSGSASMSCPATVPGELAVEAPLLVDLRQLLELVLGEAGELAGLAFDVGELGVALRAHRRELARRHRHRAGDERGGPGDEDLGAVAVGGRDADEQARGGDDAVLARRAPRPAASRRGRCDGSRGGCGSAWLQHAAPPSGRGESAASVAVPYGGKRPSRGAGHGHRRSDHRAGAGRCWSWWC